MSTSDKYDDKVYAITTLCHMGGYDCSLHRIVEFENHFLSLKEELENLRRQQLSH